MSKQNPPPVAIQDALAVSLILNRKDKPGQVPWTEWRALVQTTSNGVPSAGVIPLTRDDGKIDPSFIVGSTPTMVPFNIITSGDNIQADMVVDSGASLGYAGTGVVNANEIGTINVSGNVPDHAGQILVSQPGNASAVWVDPQILGLYPEGTPVYGPLPAYAPPTTVQPVLIGGKDTNGLLRNILTTPSGAVIVADESEDPDADRFAWDTGPDPIFLTAGVLAPLISIQPKAAATVTFYLTGADVNIMPANGEFQLIKNGTLTGAAFVDVPNSNAQEDTSATTISGGLRVDSGITHNGTRVLSYLLNFVVGDIYTLCVQPRSNATLKEYGMGALRWSEQ